MANDQKYADVRKQADKLIAEGYKNFVFLHPAYNIGGGPFIEAQMAEYISNHTNLNVYFCDYENGYGASLIEKMPKVKLLKYNEKSDAFPLQEKSVVLTNSTRAILLQKMHPENKLLFWHYETIPCGWHVVFLNNEQKKYLNLLKQNKAVIYHDWSGRDTIGKEYGVAFDNKDYFYITLKEKEQKAPQKLISNDEINVGWLSRLAPDKICSLYYLIDNVAAYATDKKKNLHIIGDGPSRAAVEKYCQKYQDKINFIFTGSVPHAQLDDYLVRNVDLLFGVGTCVLEGAALRLPSVVLLLNSKPFREEDAFWIYNSKEYCVGILKSEKERFNVPYTKISDMLDGVYKRSNGKDEQGELCYQYFKQNHTDYDGLAVNFLSYANRTTLTFKKLKKLLKYVPYCQIQRKELKIFKLSVWKKWFSPKEERGYLFGIPVYRCKYKKGWKKTYWFGVHICSSRTQKPWNFPTTQFKDGVKKKV